MAASQRLAVLCLVVFIVSFAGSVRADGADELRDELDALRSKIRALESAIEAKSKELATKEEILELKDIAIKEKAHKVDSLQAELLSLQKKGKLDAAAQIEKAHARSKELEKQIEKLNGEITSQIKQKEALESRISDSEKKISVLVLKHDNLEKTIEDQKSKIRKTERALKVAEEELVKVKLEASSKIKQLTEVHAAWLPPWLASHWSLCQSFIETHWNEHGKPAMDVIVQKAVEKKAQAEEWAAPHMEKMKTEYIPAIKEQSLAVKASLEPHVKSLTVKAVEIYETSRTAIGPHIIKLQEVADPYYQEAKTFSKPYIDQAATLSKPHIDKIRLATKPYTKKVVHAYGKFLKSASSYHHQVQGNIEETLKRHELTRSFATKEFIWFTASALLALPALIIVNFISTLFGRKSRKPVRGSHKNHTRRKAKRGQPDK
ncbi:hypothetical protein MLD38_015188 [Melastoma candidum]|uniref:Uncharacterized protein n=1 Tax=Melastoma candidum TaxID=119954 RepID=A0ACB9RGG2_9MYRT|nr:hypothetical protein MLD38_015188 [Melastoma candidum]